ncbi:hypothetical protein NUITMVRE18_27480 [Enterococcus faecium]|nr:hypothetical protein NUITMVRE1_29660 [Enterococcus faecium]GIP73858.1 hypothetical protein EFM1_26470 [Enterococcus faecium]GJG92527.1 hypothetical protein EFL1_26670 [Enterococcus faecium]GLD82649.1 hypothetical protein NUITMVRE2_26000 [Enterococcus faecium]GMR73958.1 hypothetical protein NUITMVRE10_26520 [Enterococcus faecium]
MSYSFSLVLYEHIPSLQEGNLVLLFVFPEKDIPTAKYRSYQRLVQSPPSCLLEK